MRVAVLVVKKVFFTISFHSLLTILFLVFQFKFIIGSLRRHVCVCVLQFFSFYFSQYLCHLFWRMCMYICMYICSMYGWAQRRQIFSQCDNNCSNQLPWKIKQKCCKAEKKKVTVDVHNLLNTHKCTRTLTLLHMHVVHASTCASTSIGKRLVHR